ncbi:hypothetical protein JR316_0008383 [Psilocybe cubensis]|uniref:Uncharacterized protein n=2 Tax=Psilocybe cubensis TaxID=181762 RepID=A0ACB8GW88_PSICU|nr:hypothetical protein JR316_0008383 [Psilocybe cubensis]KAH9479788.1 hypothetical protein JR316_0008383 [Psilocybe cubensis]
MRFFLAYAVISVSVAFGAVANDQQDTAVGLFPFCVNGREHCLEVLSANATAPSRTVPFGRKARLSNALLHTYTKANRASDFQRRQTSASGIPQVERTGVVQVFDDSNESIGYVSVTTEDGAIYRVDSALMNAAIVTVSSQATSASGTGLRVSVTGSDISARYPLLGLVQGRDNVDANIGFGSYHYLYLAGVALPGTSPQDSPTIIDNSYNDATELSLAAETDLWEINFSTGTMTTTWVNTNGTPENTVLFVQDGIIYAGGDMDAFANEYSGSSVTGITLKFVF